MTQLELSLALVLSCLGLEHGCPPAHTAPLESCLPYGLLYSSAACGQPQLTGQLPLVESTPQESRVATNLGFSFRTPVAQHIVGHYCRSCLTLLSIPKCTSANPITFSLASSGAIPTSQGQPPHPGSPETSRLFSSLGIPASLRLPQAICLAPAGACHRAAVLSSLFPAPQPTSALPQNLPQGFQPTHPLYLPALFPKLPFVVFLSP